MEQDNRYDRDGAFGKVQLMAHAPSLLARQLFYCVQSGGWHLCNERYRIRRSGGGPDCLLLCTVSGEGTLRYDGNEYRLVPGSAALIAPNRPHEYFTPEGGQWEFYWLHFCGAGSESFAEYIRQKNGGVLCGPVAECCSNNIQQILELKSQQELDFETVASELIAVMLHQMVSVVPVEMAGQNEVVSKVLDFIHENYQKRIELEDLCRVVFVSRAHLARIFEKTTGYTPYEYILKYRVSKAKEQLLCGTASVAEIAGMVGFSYPGNFISAFRKLEGTTPAKYRKQYFAEENIMTLERKSNGI